MHVWTVLRFHYCAYIVLALLWLVYPGSSKRVSLDVDRPRPLLAHSNKVEQAFGMLSSYDLLSCVDWWPNNKQHHPLQTDLPFDYQNTWLGEWLLSSYWKRKHDRQQDAWTPASGERHHQLVWQLCVHDVHLRHAWSHLASMVWCRKLCEWESSPHDAIIDSSWVRSCEWVQSLHLLYPWVHVHEQLYRRSSWSSYLLSLLSHFVWVLPD